MKTWPESRLKMGVKMLAVLFYTVFIWWMVGELTPPVSEFAHAMAVLGALGIGLLIHIANLLSDIRESLISPSKEREISGPGDNLTPT